MTKPDETKNVTNTHSAKKESAASVANIGAKSKGPGGVARTAKVTEKKRKASTIVRKTESTTAKKLEKTPKLKKTKMVRDTFTMPENEYAQLAGLKKKCVQAGVQVKKSELLRAGLLSLLSLSESAVIEAVVKLKKPDSGVAT